MQLLAEEGCPVQYVSLEHSGEEAATLVQDTLLRLCGRLAAKATFDSGPADSLFGMIDALTGQHCMVIDDFHDATPDCINMVHRLIQKDQENLKIILGTREPPPFPLTKMRMAGQISDFQLSDLRFTDAEAKELLQEDVDQTVLDRAEGWVAALHLMLLSPAGPQQPHGVPQAIFVDYLNEQYFRNLSEDERHLLLCTAHLDRVPPDLADLLTGKETSWALLRQLSSGQALIEEISGHDGPTYRYHQLLRDFVQKEQLRLGADHKTRLQQISSQWFRNGGDVRGAIFHAVKAGTPEVAVEILLESGGVQYAFLNGAARLRACLALLPRDHLYANPRLLVAQAYLHLKSGRVLDGAELLQEIRARCVSGDAVLERELVLVEVHLRIYRDAAISPAQIQAFEHTCRSVPASDLMMRGLLNNFLCMFLIEQGELEHAHAVGRAAMDAYVDLDAKHLQFFMLLHLSTIDIELGDVASAQARRRSARAICDNEFSFDPVMRAQADIYWGELAFEKGDTEGLKGWMQACLAGMERQESWNLMYLAGYETCLALVLFEGAFDEAVDLLEHAGRVMAERGAELFPKQLRIMELELALRADVADEAERLADDLSALLESKADNGLRWRGRLRTQLALARHAMILADFERAVSLADSALETCVTRGYVRFQERCLVFLTVVHVQQGNADLAVQTLRDYLALAVPRKTYGAVLREGAHMSETINRVISQHGLGRFSRDEIRHLSECLWRLSGRSNAKTPNILTEILTEKEVEVLSELARGDANKVIARRLEVSEPAVKFHLQNIYRKLGVNARKVAMEIARQHGLHEA